MAQNDGTLIIAEIRPNDSTDTYPVAHTNEIQGGIHQVTDITARDAITTERRIIGMLCYVISENKTYQLQGGILNTNWVPWLRMQNAYI